MPDFGRWTPNGGDPSLNEINRTDRFLDALAFEQQVYATDPGEAELIGLLSGWRDEIRGKPLTVPVTPRDAVIALDSAQRTRQKSRRTLALVGSTAAAALFLGGFASVVAGAGPGDSLYGLRTMIFGEQPAARDDAVMLASQQLAEVQQLVDEGQWDAAQQKLQTLTTTVATVNDDVRKQELVTQWQELTVKVEAQDAAAILPPDVPPPAFPEVVVLDTPTATEATSPQTTAPTTTSASETTTAPTTTSASETTTPPTTTSASETTTPPTTTSASETTTAPTSPPMQGPPPSSVPATEEPTSVPSTSPPSPTSEEEESLPASSAATSPPTTTTVAATSRAQSAPSSTVSAAAEEVPPPVGAPPATVEAPPTQQQAPPVTTTIEAPAPDAGSGGEGS